MFPGLPTKNLDPKLLIDVIDFGSNDTTVTKTIKATWVNKARPPMVSLYGETTDHDAEDIVIEEIQLTVGNIIHGVSFDVIAHAPSGTWGKYNILILGVI
jgi:hypothetical protein